MRGPKVPRIDHLCPYCGGFAGDAMEMQITVGERRCGPMSTLTRKDYRGPFADLFDWLESPLTMLHPMSAQAMRMEDYVKDGRYVVRAELPGLDPEKELDVKVASGVLSIKADRHEHAEDKHHSEFRYGSFARHIALPASADEEHIQASYDKGILEVVVDLKTKGSPATERKIPVQPIQHIRPS